MDSNVFIKNHLKIYAMELRIIKYLKKEWAINSYPTIYNIMDRFKIDDILTRSWFSCALSHLESRKFISIRKDSKEIYRIYEGSEKIPKNYDYNDYWGGI